MKERTKGGNTQIEDAEELDDTEGDALDELLNDNQELDLDNYMPTPNVQGYRDSTNSDSSQPWVFNWRINEIQKFQRYGWCDESGTMENGIAAEAFIFEMMQSDILIPATEDPTISDDEIIRILGDTILRNNNTAISPTDRQHRIHQNPRRKRRKHHQQTTQTP